MANLLKRAREAYEYFRYLGISEKWPSNADYLESKELPFAWPDLSKEEPLWHIADLSTCYQEGFNTNSLIYSAIMYKVRATITAPLRAYSGTEDDAVKLGPEDPLTQRLRNPNPRQSWTEFHSRNVVFLNIAGNVYIYIDPVSGEMYSLNPDRMYIIPNADEIADLKGFLYVEEGKPVEAGIPILPADMLHIKLPNPADPLEGMGYGLSPISAAAQSTDVDNMVTKFLNLFFKKGGMLTGVLQFEVPLKDDVVDTILERWEKKYGGFENWKVGVLDRGAKYNRVGLTFEEMGFGEIDARSETRILGPFGIAPILIGAKIGLERSTYSNYEAARQAVWEDTLVPELELFQIEYQTRFNEPGRFVKFDYSGVPALQRALPRQISAAFTLVQMRVPPNQALRAVGLSIGPIPDGDKPVDLSGPGKLQGPRSDADEDSWGMRDESSD